MNKWNGFQNDIDDPALLDEVKWCMGRDYYIRARQWLNIFNGAPWWKEDLR